MTRDISDGAENRRLPQGDFTSVDDKSEVATWFADLESSLSNQSQNKDSSPLSEDRTQASEKSPPFPLRQNIWKQELESQKSMSSCWPSSWLVCTSPQLPINPQIGLGFTSVFPKALI